MDKKTTLEYELAPSGAILLGNYKEPLMEFRDKDTGKGFGFEGVVMADLNGKVIQCHLCGEWFSILHPHLRNTHDMTVNQYKEKTGLLRNIGLISENVRQRLIQNKSKQAFKIKNFGHKKGVKLSEATKNKIRATLRENSLRRQSQNKNGTCPLQLKYAYWNLKAKVGRQPTLQEFQKHTTHQFPVIYKSFGSYTNFVRECDGEYIQSDFRKQNLLKGRKIFLEKSNKRTREIFASMYAKYGYDFNAKTIRDELGIKYRQAHSYFAQIRRLPDYKVDYFDLKEAKRQQTERTRLNEFRVFYEVNKRYPTLSDFKRKLIGGSICWYFRHFGTMKETLLKARSLV